MRMQLILLTMLLPLTPYIISILYGNSLTRFLALAFMALTLIVGALGVLRGNPLIGPLISIVFTSLVSILSYGYLVYTIHTYVLYMNRLGLTALGYSIALVELAVVSSMMLRMYDRMYSELINKGYDGDEVRDELGKYVKNVLALSIIAVVISIVVYELFSLASISIIDPVTALVIFLIIYISLLRYLTSQ